MSGSLSGSARVWRKWHRFSLFVTTHHWLKTLLPSTYICFIWSLKLNMLFFYQRLTNGLWVSKLIVPLMVVVGCTFVTVITILFASCRPYQNMWVVWPQQGGEFLPPTSSHSTRRATSRLIHLSKRLANCMPQAEIYMLPPLILNLLTDIAIMAIPAPVVLPAKMTIARKISVLILFGGGIFVMVAAVLRVTMVLLVSLHADTLCADSLPMVPSQRNNH